MVLMLLSMLIWQQPHQQLTVAALSRALAWLTSTTGAARCVVTTVLLQTAVYCTIMLMCIWLACVLCKMGSHAVDAFGHIVFATVLVVVAAAVGVNTVKLLCCADNGTDHSSSSSVQPLHCCSICHQRVLA
jgi:hypothetical protein